MIMSSNEELPAAERLRRDVIVARFAAKEFGVLPGSVYSGLSSWFGDVDELVEYPLPVMDLSDEERITLLTTALEEMLGHVEAFVNAGAVDEQLGALAGLIDPLWVEVRSIHAREVNASWRAKAPSDASEREERMMLLEAMTGLSRDELATAMAANQRLRALASRLGLSIRDFS